MYDQPRQTPQRPVSSSLSAAPSRTAGHRGRGLPRRARAAIVVLVQIVGPVLALLPVCAAELGLDTGPYPYVVVDQDIKGVLVEFGRNTGLPVDVSDQVKGRMRGEHTSGSARQFLDGLCDSYGLVWYYDGRVLHVSAKSEIRTEVVDVRPATLMDALDYLNRVGVSDQRFAVERTDDVSTVAISGPPAFINLARKELMALARRPRDDGEAYMRVFRGGTTPVPEPVAAPSRGRFEGVNRR